MEEIEAKTKELVGMYTVIVHLKEAFWSRDKLVFQ